MHTHELALVVAAVAGDREAFSTLCQQYTRPIVGLIYTIVGDGEAARDIAQDAFLKAYRSMGSLLRPDRFGPWLRQIAANEARSYLRRLRPLVPLEEVTATTEFTLPDDDAARLLQSLPEQTREAMVLHYIMGLEPVAAARQLGISRAAFDTRLSRGREALRAQPTRIMDQSMAGPEARVAAYLEGFADRVRSALEQERRERAVAAKEVALLAARANLPRLEQDLKSHDAHRRQGGTTDARPGRSPLQRSAVSGVDQ